MRSASSFEDLDSSSGVRSADGYLGYNQELIRASSPNVRSSNDEEKPASERKGADESQLKFGAL